LQGYIGVENVKSGLGDKSIHGGDTGKGLEDSLIFQGFMINRMSAMQHADIACFAASIFKTNGEDRGSHGLSRSQSHM
jgi:hypothetical protein